MAKLSFWELLFAAVSALSAFGATIAAVVSIRQVNAGREAEDLRRREDDARHAEVLKAELKRQRPNIELVRGQFGRDSEAGSYQMVFTFRNAGVRAATNLTEEVWLIEPGKAPRPSRNSIANELASGIEVAWRIRPLVWPADVPPQLGALRVRYGDPLDPDDSTRIEKFFFVTWAGMKGGDFAPSVDHASQDEAALIRKQLEDAGLL